MSETTKQYDEEYSNNNRKHRVSKQCKLCANFKDDNCKFSSITKDSPDYRVVRPMGKPCPEFKFNMNQCKANDIVLSKCGQVLRYVGKIGLNPECPHIIMYHGGCYGERTDGGEMFCDEPVIDSDNNIIGFADTVKR